MLRQHDLSSSKIAENWDDESAQGDETDAVGAVSDNVFEDAGEAAAWATARGLSLSELEADAAGHAFDQLILRCIHHDGNESGTASWTSALLDASTAAALDANGPFASDVLSLSNPSLFEMGPVPKLAADASQARRGLIATADIPAGTILVAERPALLLPAVLPLSGVASSVDELCRALFDRLDPTMRDAVQGLINSKPEGTCSVEEGIVRTNGISVGLPKNGGHSTYSGVFPTINRCNHR
jgi:hypothetical protein